MKNIRYLSMMMVLLIGAIIGGHALNQPVPQADDDQGALTLVADPSDGGSVSGGGTFATGSSVSLRASAATGFVFVNWTATDGTVVSETANFTYTKQAGDEVLTAHFKYSPGSPGEPVTPVFPEKPVIKPSHSITVSVTPADAGSVSTSAATVEEESTATISTSAASGFTFLGWYVADTLYSSDIRFTYTMGTSDIHFEARYIYQPGSPDEPVTPIFPDKPVIKQSHNITVSVTPADAGSVSTSAVTVEEESTATISTSARSGFTFLGWYVADTLYSSDILFTYTMGTSDIHFEARYIYKPDSPSEPDKPDIPDVPKPKAKHRVTVSVEPADGGSVSVDNNDVEEDASTTIRTSAATGFAFLGWYNADTLYSSSFNTTVIMGLTDMAFTARYRYSPDSPSEPNSPLTTSKFSLYLSSMRGMPGRTIQYPVYLNTEDTVCNMRFRLTFPKGATPNMESLRLSGKAIGYTVTYRQVQVTEADTIANDTTIAGAGAKSRKKADAVATAYEVELEGGQTAPCNTRLLTISVDLDENFTGDETQKVSINQISMTNTDGTTQTAAARNGSLLLREPAGEGVYYYVTIISTGNGTTRCGNQTSYNSLCVADFLEGSSQNIYFAPDNGYHLHQVVLNEEDITSQVTNNRLLLSGLQDDATMEVTFAEGASASYPVTVTASEGGTVKYNGTNISGGQEVFNVSHGAEMIIDITPNPGYHIAEVLVNNTNYTDSVAGGQLNFVTVTESKDISVTFEQTLHTLTVAASDGGCMVYGTDTIASGSSNYSVTELSTVNLTVVPETGYMVSTLTINGEDALASLAGNTLTIANITTTQTVVATFEQMLFDLSVSANGNGELLVILSDTTGTDTASIAPQPTQTIGLKEVSEIVSTDSYYLYNVEAGRFWGCANDWGTQASLVEHAELLRLYPQADGTFFMVSQRSNGGSSYYFGANGYMDTETPVALTITKVTANDGTPVFTIGNGTSLYGYDGSSTVLATGVSAEGAIWKIYSWADMYSLLNQANYENPVDATWLIIDPGFGRNNILSASWTFDATGSTTISGGNNVNNCAEAYHTDFVLSQTAVNVPNGRYTLKAQGFYRQDGNNQTDLPVFFINGAIRTFPVRTGTENSMNDASESFTNGLYTIEPIEVEVTDGTITLGARLENNTALWCIWDNFELTYYGTGSAVTEGPEVTNDTIVVRNGTQTLQMPYLSNVRIEVVPDRGSHASEITLNGADITGQDMFKIRNIAEANTVTATFEQTMHQMFLGVSGNGTLFISDVDSIRNNYISEIRSIPEYAPTTLILKPDAGNRIDTIYVLDEFRNPLDASSLTTLHDDVLTIHDVTQTIMLYVRFVPISHNIHISKSGSGQVVIEGTGISQGYVADTVQTYNTYSAQISQCEAAGGWHLAQITYNGNPLSLDSLNKILNNLTADADIHIAFEQNMLALEVDVTAGGAVVFNTPFDGTALHGEAHEEYEVAELSELSLNFVPVEGYHLVSVLVNGVVADMQGGNTLSITSMNEPTTIAANFAQNMQGLTIHAYGKGRVVYDSNLIIGDNDSISSRNFDVAEFSSITISFVPNEGYHLESVMVNGINMISSVNNNELTLSNIEASTEVVATFAQSYYRLHVLAEGNGTIAFMVHPKDSIHGGEDDSVIESSIRNGGEGYDVPTGATIDFVLTPDNGYHIASLLLNNADAMSGLHGDTLTIENIKADAIVETVFEQTMYALTLNASGNGSVVYGDSTLRNKSQYFNVGEFADAVISIVPDAGYHISSVTLNGEDAMSRIDSDGKLTLNSVTEPTTVAVVFTPTIHDVIVEVRGYGINAIFNEIPIVIEPGDIRRFSVDELSNPVIRFEQSTTEPYIVGQLTLNGTDVTSQIEHNQFILPSVERNDTVVVIGEWGGPVMELTAEGSGVIEYYNHTLRDSTGTFSIYYSPVSVNVVPDAGARILKIEKDSIDITENYNTTVGTSNQIHLLSGPNVAQDDISLHVTFINTYELKVTTIEGDSIKNIHTSRLDEGKSDTISIVPDDGWILSGVTVNGKDRMSDVENNMIVIADIREAMNVVVTYERAEFPLLVEVEGRGSVKFVNTGDETTGGTTDSIAVSFAQFPLTFDFTPDFGAELISVVVNNTDMTSQLSVLDDDKMHLVLDSNIMEGNVALSLKVVYADYSDMIIADGLRFRIIEPGSNRLSLIGVEPAEHIFVPEEVSYKDDTYIVVDIDADALSESRGCLITIDLPATITSAASGIFTSCQHLSAITWRSITPLTTDMMLGCDNSNLLLYVQPGTNATSVYNTIDLEHLTAESIKLYDDSGDFYCPTPFVAKMIEYSHTYNQATQTGVCEGWETIVLPFDVATITHETQGEIHPFATLLDEQIEDGERPFWLYEYHETGNWIEAEGIRANVPYIISMPNEPDLWDIYILGGKVTFSSTNAQVAATADAHSVESSERTFIPSFRNDAQHVPGRYLMNVDDAYDVHLAGSIFSTERDERASHPFEAYFESAAQNPVKGYMDIFDDGAVDIRFIRNGVGKSVEGIYDISGRRINGELLAPGVYIVNGKKVFIK